MVRCTFLPAWAWRPAVVARLARTLGRTQRPLANHLCASGSLHVKTVLPRPQAMHEANYISPEGSLHTSPPSLTPSKRKRKRWASMVVFTGAIQPGQRSRPLAFAGSSDRSSNPVKVEPQSILITLHRANREAKSPSQEDRTHRAPSRSTEGSSRTATACGILKRVKVTSAQSSAA